MKKILALVLALAMALCAMSISVFAENIVLFDNADGDTLGIVDPWDGFGIGVAVNEKTVGEVTLDDVKAWATQGGVKVVMVFSTTAFATWQTHAPEIQFNCWDNEEALQTNFEVTDLGDGKYQGVVEIDTLVANLEAAGLTVDGINNLGIQVWCDNFTLYSLSVLTGGETVDAPVAEEEAPAEEVEEVPAEEEAPATEEAPAEETEPAETGLALAVVPMLVAAAAVVISKKR